MFGLFNAEADRIKIVTLLSHIRDSSLVEDKEEALKSLSDIAKKNPLEVGEVCFDDLCQVIQNADTIHFALVELSLEIILDLLGAPPKEAEYQEEIQTDAKGKPFYEINMDLFLDKHFGRIEILLECLASNVPAYQYYTVQILTLLLLGRGNQVRRQIASISDCIVKLVSLLNTEFPDLRDATVYMLKLLTLSDTTSGESIQKLVVYHGAFERIFDIADVEGYYHGGPVVEDCLSLLENLIRENVSNQNYFLEFDSLKRLPIFFHSVDDLDINGLRMLIQIVKVVEYIMKGNGGKSSTKSHFGADGGAMIKTLLLFAANHRFPPDDAATLEIYDELCMLRCRCLTIVGNVIENHNNRNLMAGMKVQVQFYENERPQEDVRGVLQYLLDLSLGNRYRTSVDLGDVAIIILKKYLKGNRQGQLQACADFLSPQNAGEFHAGSEREELAFGRQLIESITVWNRTGRFDDHRAFCRGLCIVGEILRDNSDTKTMALKLPISPNLEEKYTLQDTIHDILIATTRQRMDPSIQISLLMLLIIWFHECSTAITHVLNSVNLFDIFIQLSTRTSPDDIHQRGLSSFIIAQCLEFVPNFCPNSHGNEYEYQGEFIFDVITKQIKFEQFKTNLDNLSKSKEFLKGNLYDDQFRNIFDSVYKVIDSRVLNLFNRNRNPEPCSNEESQLMSRELERLRDENQSLGKKYNLLKSSKVDTEEVEKLRKHVRELQIDNENYCQENEKAHNVIKEKDVIIKKLEKEIKNNNNTDLLPSTTKNTTAQQQNRQAIDEEFMNKLREENDSLMILLCDMQLQMEQLEADKLKLEKDAEVKKQKKVAHV